MGQKKKYEFVNHKDIKKLFDNDVDRPYVLFYKKNDNEKIERKVEVEDLKSKDVLIKNKYNLENNNNNNNNYITNHVNNNNNNLNYEDNNNINNNHTNNHINNHINNNYENHINNNYNNHFSNNKELISNEESSDNNNHVNNINNINNINDNNKIILYFQFKFKGKGLYIDTNNNIPFFKIVNQLEEKYKDEFDLKIDLNKLYFNDKKIDPKKTPKEYNIPYEEYIIVDDS